MEEDSLGTGRILTEVKSERHNQKQGSSLHGPKFVHYQSLIRDGTQFGAGYETTLTLSNKHRRKDDKAKDILVSGMIDEEQSYVESASEDSSCLSVEEFEEHQTGEEQPAFVPLMPMPVADVIKLSPELRHAYRICRELMAEQYRSVNEPFYYPVNPAELGLSDYYQRIKKPMDLSTIHAKFTSEKYADITEFVADVRLLIENCFRYNGITHPISKKAEKLEQILEQKLALLSRSLREKTSLIATNVVQGKGHLNSFIQSGSRRRSARLGNEGESPIIMQIKQEEEYEEKYRKKQKEKERKDAEEAKINDLQEWDDKVLTPDCLHEISTMWEIPSVGLFLCIMQEFLNLHDFNYTEFELGTLFPHKSSLIAKIFTSLLVTQLQRQRLARQNPMHYKNWSTKVRCKLQTWYKMAESRGKLYASSLWGFDIELFDVLGSKMPLENAMFHELTLKQRMWILKALCEACLEEDTDMKEYLAKLEPLDREDLNLGQDADKFSYHYFPQFGSSDVRVYKQIISSKPVVPKFGNDLLADLNGNENKVKKEGTGDSSKGKKRGKVTNTPHASKKHLHTTKIKGDMVSDAMSFELVAWDVQSLRELTANFAEQPKKRGVKYIPRKPCVVDLHQTLEAILEEVSKREAGFLKSMQKAKLKVMDEYDGPDPMEQTSDNGDVSSRAKEWDSDYEDENDVEVDRKNVKQEIEHQSLPNGSVSKIKQEPSSADSSKTSKEPPKQVVGTEKGVKSETVEDSASVYVGVSYVRCLRRTRQRTEKASAYGEQLNQERKQQRAKNSKQQKSLLRDNKGPGNHVDMSDKTGKVKTGSQGRGELSSDQQIEHRKSKHRESGMKDEPPAKKRKTLYGDPPVSVPAKGKSSKMTLTVPRTNLVFDGLHALADIASLTQMQEIKTQPSYVPSTESNRGTEGLSSAMLSAKASKLNLSSVLKSPTDSESNKKALTVTVVSSHGQEEKNLTLKKWSRPNILSAKSPKATGKSNVKIVASPSSTAGKQSRSKGSSFKELGKDLPATAPVMSPFPNSNNLLHSRQPSTCSRSSFSGQESRTVPDCSTPSVDGHSKRRTCTATTVWPVAGKPAVSKPPGTSSTSSSEVSKVQFLNLKPSLATSMGGGAGRHEIPSVAIQLPNQLLAQVGIDASAAGQPLPAKFNSALLSQILTVPTGSGKQVLTQLPFLTLPRAVRQSSTSSSQDSPAKLQVPGAVQTLTTPSHASTSGLKVRVVNPQLVTSQQAPEKKEENLNSKGPVAILPKGRESLVDATGSSNSRETLLEQVNHILRTRGITLPKPRRESKEAPNVGSFKSSVGAKYDLEAALSVVRSSMAAPRSVPGSQSAGVTKVTKVSKAADKSKSSAAVPSEPSTTTSVVAVAVSSHSTVLSSPLVTVNTVTKPHPIAIAPVRQSALHASTPKVALAPATAANKAAYTVPIGFKTNPDAKSTPEGQANQHSSAPRHFMAAPPTVLIPSSPAVSVPQKAVTVAQNVALSVPQPSQVSTAKLMAIQVLPHSSSAGTLVNPLQQRMSAVTTVQTIQVIPSFSAVSSLIKPATAPGMTATTAVFSSPVTTNLNAAAPSLNTLSDGVIPHVLLPAAVRPVTFQPVQLVSGGVPQALIPVPFITSQARVNESQKSQASSSPTDAAGNSNRSLDKGQMETNSSKKEEIQHDGVDPAECDMFGHWRTIMCKSNKRFKSENVLIDVSSRSKAAKLISDIKKGSSSRQSPTDSNTERAAALFCNERLSPTQDLPSSGKAFHGSVISTRSVPPKSPQAVVTSSPPFSPSLSPSASLAANASHSSPFSFSKSVGIDEGCDDITARPLPDPKQLTKSITSLNTSTHFSSLDSVPDDTKCSPSTIHSSDPATMRTTTPLQLQMGISSKVRKLLSGSISKPPGGDDAKKLVATSSDLEASSCDLLPPGRPNGLRSKTDSAPVEEKGTS